MTLGLIVAVVLGLLALWQRNQAIDQANIANARQLAAQSELTRQASFIDRSVLLAVESMRRFPSSEADQALRGGLALLRRPGPRLAHESGAKAIAFSPNGKYLATASSRSHGIA